MSDGNGKGSTPTTGKARKKSQRTPRGEPAHVDREAVRAVLSQSGFSEIEQIYKEFHPAGGCEEFFWRLAREQMVRLAQQRNDGAEKIMRAKVAAVGTFLGLNPEQILKLLQDVDLGRFAAAAARNIAIQQFQSDPRFRSLWTDETIRTNPPLRVEFEYATFFGSVGEAGDIAKNKSWGALIGLEPLRVDDRLYPQNVSYILKATSKQRMRWEWRDSFRAILGTKRGLVSAALRKTKKGFLKEMSDGDEKVIRDRLDLTPGDFWRMVRYGDRFGPDGIVAFVERLEEKTKGYSLPFPPPDHSLVQIQPAAPPT